MPARENVLIWNVRQATLDTAIGSSAVMSSWPAASARSGRSAPVIRLISGLAGAVRTDQRVAQALRQRNRHVLRDDKEPKLCAVRSFAAGRSARGPRNMEPQMNADEADIPCSGALLEPSLFLSRSSAFIWVENLSGYRGEAARMPFGRNSTTLISIGRSRNTSIAGSCRKVGRAPP